MPDTETQALRLPFTGTTKRSGHDLFRSGEAVRLEPTEDGVRLSCGREKRVVFEAGESVEAIVGRARTDDGELTVVFVPSPLAKNRLVGIALAEDGRIITVGEHIVEDDGDGDGDSDGREC